MSYDRLITVVNHKLKSKYFHPKNAFFLALAVTVFLILVNSNVLVTYGHELLINNGTAVLTQCYSTDDPKTAWMQVWEMVFCEAIQIFESDSFINIQVIFAGTFGALLLRALYSHGDLQHFPHHHVRPEKVCGDIGCRPRQENQFHEPNSDQHHGFIYCHDRSGLDCSNILQPTSWVRDWYHHHFSG